MAKKLIFKTIKLKLKQPTYAKFKMPKLAKIKVGSIPKLSKYKRVALKLK